MGRGSRVRLVSSAISSIEGRQVEIGITPAVVEVVSHSGQKTEGKRSRKRRMIDNIVGTERTTPLFREVPC